MFATLILSSLVALATAAPQSNTAQLNLPNNTRTNSRMLLTLDDGSVDIRVLLATTARTLSRYVLNKRYLRSVPEDSSLQKRAGGFAYGVISLADCVIDKVDTGYAIPMRINDQANQTFSLLLDTGKNI